MGNDDGDLDEDLEERKALSRDVSFRRGLHHHVGRERRRLARRPLLLRSFFRHSTLPFHV